MSLIQINEKKKMNMHLRKMCTSIDEHFTQIACLVNTKWPGFHIIVAKKLHITRV